MFATEAQMSNDFGTKPLAARVASPSRPARPRFGKIPAAVHYSGLSRSKLYEIAAANLGLFRKSGATTLVDYEVLDKILNNLPVAVIKPSRREKFGTGGIGSSAHFGSPRPPDRRDERIDEVPNSSS
jgi:hypothetical protein